jgi:uncharacterized membrane protein YdjX (TVP38/TMEM64 family)
MKALLEGIVVGVLMVITTFAVGCACLFAAVRFLLWDWWHDDGDQWENR